MNKQSTFRIHLKTAAICVGLLAGLTGASASAQSTPSAKATFAYTSLTVLPPCNSTDAAGCAGSGSDGWTSILKQQLKTANQKDLFINASLQCGIVTDTTVKSTNGSLDTAEARATIRVKVKITSPTGVVSYAQPSTGRDAMNTVGDGIVFCDRSQTLKARFSGLNCKADAYGVVTCADPEELQLILKTLNANAFNFVAPGMDSGVNTIEVLARSSATASATGTNGSLGSANAFIGAGSVAVEEVRMIKGNTGETISF
ncbi:hypothetical protein [Massilia sp. CCM 8734]|uniref:hypothetical protein n=1 Tax=Massilia sp. CCM 8734 TaxID=2609283 RepID=UPI00142332BB|nr:hypothetical protein [Massilia sp. CCM 8734]NHZ94308.1 hypothetical protein [Massilia sp. CCM 8734]